MKFLTILIISSVIVEMSLASFSCPPQEEIFPCRCHHRPKMIVTCDGISDLESVRNALEGHIPQILPKLELKNVHTFSLPSHALGNILPMKLTISDSNIRDIDDDAFEGQNALGLLVLEDDRLEDIPTQALKHLKYLRTLSLTGNFLMKVQQGSFSSMTHLKFLSLSGNRLSEIDKNAFPSSMDMISLSRNLLRTLNGSLINMANLTEIYATDNRLTNVRGEFIGLSNLTGLSLDRNYISEIPESFAQLSSLTKLTMSNNRIYDVGKALMSLTGLKILNLSNNYITHLHWRIFEKLNHLETLDLSGNFLKTICPTLKPLKSIRTLNISDLNLKSLDMDCFQNMKSLKSLDLSQNHLMTIDSITHHALPRLTHLYLKNNRLTALNYEMRHLKSLYDLDISFNNITSFKTNYLAYNRELTSIKIGGNHWMCTEPVIQFLGDMEVKGVDIQGRPNC